jgi:SAM-dependent methyltransferase
VALRACRDLDVMDERTFIRYLAAKKTVDDRSLNRRVWDSMTALLEGRAPRVLELGAGIGTMVEREAGRPGGLRPESWALLDSQPVLLDEARRRLSGRVPFPTRFLEADAESFLGACSERFDLVLAHAFIDLFDPARLLPAFLRVVAPAGCLLFTVSFDGLSAWEPEIDADLDARVVSLYHRTMDERITAGKASGDSRAGRHLLTLLPRLGCRIEEAGASDWIVLPRDGSYPADERFFLSCILGFVEESLSARPELDRGDLDRWLQTRRAQLESGRLVFIAHQLDVLAVAGD